jgi:exodeoxyribonuclease-3
MEFSQCEQPDILCLQEAKLQVGQLELKMLGYHQYWNCAEKTVSFVAASPVYVQTLNAELNEEDKAKNAENVLLDLERFS